MREAEDLAVAAGTAEFGTECGNRSLALALLALAPLLLARLG